MHKILCIFPTNSPACAYNRNWQKSWLLACTYPTMKSLGAKCSHPFGTHEPIARVRNLDGSYKSRDTAKYPAEMCTAIASLISPLCSSSQGAILDISSLWHIAPFKGLSDLPVSYEDGGGLFSEPDWCRPCRTSPDCFHTLRRQWVQTILQKWFMFKVDPFFEKRGQSTSLLRFRFASFS